MIYASNNFSQSSQIYFKVNQRKDWPVLDTFTFVLLWLEYVIVQSIVRMRKLFQKLNYQGINLKISNSKRAS